MHGRNDMSNHIHWYGMIFYCACVCVCVCGMIVDSIVEKSYEKVNALAVQYEIPDEGFSPNTVLARIQDMRSCDVNGEEGATFACVKSHCLIICLVFYEYVAETSDNIKH